MTIKEQLRQTTASGTNEQKRKSIENLNDKNVVQMMHGNGYKVSICSLNMTHTHKNDNPESSNSIMTRVIECYHKNKMELLPRQEDSVEKKVRRNN